MFTTKTIYKICFVLLGAVSVRGDFVDDGNCWVTPDIDGVVNIPDGTETITDDAFFGCDALKAVNIPASVQNIGSYSFYQTENLETVIFEEGSLLEVIGFGAFEYCDSLKNITLPANLKSIGGDAFALSGLEKVIFEEGSELETIDTSAFWGNNLQTVNIPSGVETKRWVFDKTGCPEDIFTPGATIVDCRVTVETEGPISTKGPLRGHKIVPSE
mmetsp:Transcript_34159/g.67246  ORF Transcript_34159/g.67246 Transcript_34159/m.67246 type:complete len:215 (+) Transcript_34159:123-767(+)